MANFNTLPMELVIEIVKASLALVHDTAHLPTIGLDASYFVPHDTNLDFKESGASRAESMDSTRAVVSLSLASKPDGPHRTSSQPPFGLCIMNKSLRL
jgi:hypothetical protein